MPSAGWHCHDHWCRQITWYRDDCRIARPVSGTAVTVFQANNIVFTEVLPALYFDHDQVDQAGVFYPMAMTCRNECGFIGVDQKHFVAIGDLCHAVDDNPVLTSVMMHLQRQGGSGLDFNALDFEPVTFFQSGEFSPWSVDGLVQSVGFVIVSFQLFNDTFYILGVVFVCDQKSVVGIDYHEIFNTYCCYQAAMAADVGIFGID